MRAVTGLLDVQPFAGALEAVERILNREPEPDEALRQVVAALHDRVEHYTWVGLYFVDEGGLALGPWKGDAGRPEHTRLPLAAGAIGRAVDERHTVVVLDDPGIGDGDPLLPSLRAEIDVPVLYDGRPVAVIGISSSRLTPFGRADEACLERVARLVSAHCLVGWDTDGIPWSEVS